ncbi:MAG: HNH endonuclease signature motif containing protein [Pseudomonas sp.]|uniref:HNH endonuclease signature motif containing protein n=1 Tax=Pseudomonas sp. TaxID=306 RepID=UPI00299EBEB0|nr:HNH endonuclease signature motif containing protein [Pseudomonas sp.]MDX1723731.1 HNH endonuclease signature motif containing protein [Pseudomonas sp.]
MDCRNQRAKVRTEKIKKNGGSHTSAEWKLLLARSPTCAVCGRLWSEVPKRPDPRYKHTWTKGHKIPIHHGGSDDISNIQVECYECNFKKNAGKLSITKTALHNKISTSTTENIMATSQERFSKKFSFVLHNETEVFPVQMKRRDTGSIAFRISPGGTGGNTLEASEEVDEETMVRKVLNEGYAVRCKSLDGNTNGLYKHGHRSVREVRRNVT